MTKSNPANIDRESARSILAGLEEARLRTLELVADLDDRQLMGPQLKIVNPLRWEIGHVAFFQEFWCLRHFRGELPILKNGDQLYDSARVAHDTRWGLPLPSRRDTLDYMQRVLERVIELNKTETEKQIDGYGQNYFLQLALFHEQMHAEAIGYTRQTLEYPPPSFTTNPLPSLFEPSHDIIRGDAIIPGGRFVMGGNRRAGFVFDNEERDHEAFVEPFSMSRTAVTQAEFLAFVEDGGYRRPELWSEPGWAWRCAVSAECPVYWRRQSGANWSRRRFDEWVPLEDRLPVIHVNWYEADAYCRWSHRRLPTEAEWEMAATCEPASTDNELSPRKRVYAWGDEPPTITRANLDWRAMGCIAVDALPESDSAFGCRQMIGNCWEWTATDFAAYPGFKPGPYKEYSEPWFGDHKVLRGGCWTTRSSMIRSSYRNFYTPDRRDVWAGFRTCAV